MLRSYFRGPLFSREWGIALGAFCCGFNFLLFLAQPDSWRAWAGIVVGVVCAASNWSGD